MRVCMRKTDIRDLVEMDRRKTDFENEKLRRKYTDREKRASVRWIINRHKNSPHVSSLLSKRKDKESEEILINRINMEREIEGRKIMEIYKQNCFYCCRCKI